MDGDGLLQHLGPAAQPIIEALRLQLPSRDIQLSALHLVIQHGSELRWNWSVVGTVHLTAPARA